MPHVSDFFLSWSNNKHYPVMYAGLFYHCWHGEACERTEDTFNNTSSLVGIPMWYTRLLTWKHWQLTILKQINT